MMGHVAAESPRTLRTHLRFCVEKPLCQNTLRKCWRLLEALIFIYHIKVDPNRTDIAYKLHLHPMYPPTFPDGAPNAGGSNSWLPVFIFTAVSCTTHYILE